MLENGLVGKNKYKGKNKIINFYVKYEKKLNKFLKHLTFKKQRFVLVLKVISLVTMVK